MVTEIAGVRSTRRDDGAPVTVAAAAAVSAAFVTRGYERSGWTTATIAVMSRVYARGGRPTATALRAVVVCGRARACFPFCGPAADCRRGAHAHVQQRYGCFYFYFSNFSQELCGDDDDVCF